MQMICYFSLMTLTHLCKTALGLQNLTEWLRINHLTTYCEYKGCCLLVSTYHLQTGNIQYLRISIHTQMSSKFYTGETATPTFIFPFVEEKEQLSCFW